MVGRRQRAGEGEEEEEEESAAPRSRTKKGTGKGCGERWWSVSFICQALRVPDGGPVPAGMPSTDGRTDMHVASGEGEPGASSPRAFWTRGGEGVCEGSTLACALSPAAAGAVRWGRAQRRPQEHRGQPQSPHPACRILPQQGAQALLSAGLSPRAAASSLKEGRSLGLGAQQRCISLARREGQPSGCGSFVFPDCRPGKEAKAEGMLGGGTIPSMGSEEHPPRGLSALRPSHGLAGPKKRTEAAMHEVLHIPARTSSSASGAYGISPCVNTSHMSTPKDHTSDLVENSSSSTASGGIQRSGIQAWRKW